MPTGFQPHCGPVNSVVSFANPIIELNDEIEIVLSLLPFISGVWEGQRRRKYVISLAPSSLDKEGLPPKSFIYI